MSRDLILQDHACKHKTNQTKQIFIHWILTFSFSHWMLSQNTIQVGRWNWWKSSKSYLKFHGLAVFRITIKCPNWAVLNTSSNLLWWCALIKLDLLLKKMTHKLIPNKLAFELNFRNWTLIKQRHNIFRLFNTIRKLLRKRKLRPWYSAFLFQKK